MAAYDLYQDPNFDPTRYYFGKGPGVGIFNRQYRPTIQDVLTRKYRPEITGMPGDPVYMDQMSNPQYISRVGPDIFFQKRRDPLGVNLYPNVAGLGFTPSAGLMGEDIQPATGDLSSAPSGSRYINQTLSDQYLRSATGEAPSEAEPQAELQAEPQGRTLGLLGDMFGGASAFDEYMTPEQKSQLQNQAMMAAAMQLLAASGPSRVPVGLGQAIGQAYGAGQQGYTAAQQNLLQSMAMKQKMDEAKAAKDMQANVANFMAQPAPEGVDPKEFKAQQYMKLADVYAARNPEQASKFFDMAQKLMPVADKPVGEPFRAADGNYYQRTESGSVKLFGGGTVAPAAKPTGKPEQQLVDGKVQMVQYYDDGTFKVVSGVGQVAKPQGEPKMQLVDGVPKMVQYYDDGTRKVIEGVSQYNAPSSDVTNLEYLTSKSLAGTGAAGIAKVQDYRKSGATSLSINTGEKGFQHEFDLKKSFGNEPIYKEFQGMKSAFSQVQESLKKENPIGDVAAATKIMKLLDPGSVVRESELGIAMAASGKMDRLTNYVDMWKKGTLLTPSQRIEFGALANELYNASARAYNEKRNEYASFGAKYDIDANTALGATAPVFTYTPPAAPAATGAPVLTWDPTTKKWK